MRPVGRERAEAVISYFKGGLEGNHAAGIPTHRSLVYEGLWPGIDLEYTAASHQLKYTFTVAPGADPDQIKLAFRSAEVTLNGDGQLVVLMPVGSFVDDAPYVYQEVGESRVDVPARYQLDEAQAGQGQIVTFRLGAYDPNQNTPLFFDTIPSPSFAQCKSICTCLPSRSTMVSSLPTHS